MSWRSGSCFRVRGQSSSPCRAERRPRPGLRPPFHGHSSAVESELSRVLKTSQVPPVALGLARRGGWRRFPRPSEAKARGAGYGCGRPGAGRRVKGRVRRAGRVLVEPLCGWRTFSVRPRRSAPPRYCCGSESVTCQARVLICRGALRCLRLWAPSSGTRPFINAKLSLRVFCCSLPARRAGNACANVRHPALVLFHSIINTAVHFGVL